ncbi:MAG TPA: penicillin-binding transpeptidase domain-containing protein [Desulfitobacteriaceae bacterium]|jgi:peptidoglycan glycosyltransferase|nr:penicillin-binding transpeptidase domain-containing protein [Desulfitobacteriaceae bacterium]
MNRGLRQVAVGFALCFFLLSLGLVYWQVIESDSLLENPTNRRLIRMEERVLRGGIFDRNGEVLAQTTTNSGKRLRVYPKGEMMEPLLGYATLMHGSAGLEGSLSDWLLGLKNASPIQIIQQALALPRQGDDVVLTIDGSLQQAAYEGLKGKTGSAVAVNPKTGEVLALVSQPSFNPEDLDNNWQEIVARPNSPLVNHAFSLFPPGSTMKVVTSLAIIRSGLNTTDLYECTGSTIINGQEINDDRVHGWVNFNTALADSCNTYFATYAMQAGDQNFLAATRAFGFGQIIPFELPVPKSSILNQEPNPKQLDTNFLSASAFGQGQVLTSPMHMALIAAGIANNGVIMTPHLVQRVLDSEQNLLYVFPNKPWLTALSSEEAAKIKSAMITAVNSGTAYQSALADVQVAAKTGTAEPGTNMGTHAWFIAFAPAEDPQIAVAVLVENGGIGGGVAAPIARDLIDKALSRKVGDNK